MSAENNFCQRIQKCPYPGRGLVMGVLEDGKTLAQLYWIMGRSSNSRNRIFSAKGAMLETEAADPALLEDPSLVIYEAMLEWGDSYLVSNGDQTRTVYQSLAAGHSFESALCSRDREPDAPNYTPRITGCIDTKNSEPFFRFAIIKANSSDPKLSDRNFFYKEKIAPGTGFLLTTYEGDGNPLPSFQGEPVATPLMGHHETILTHYWDALDTDNKVSLALKTIDLASGVSSISIKNKNIKKN
ncbi:MAG: inosine monophosphate cyclohydrolase [Planctomycetes bacterium]|nr:inosine monophosphate cyclohydrolase [Planctomycetota bacterium]